jgi:L-aminopeptidase/D-esterase-like protein
LKGSARPLNLITDVAGLRVGSAEDMAALTGVTVLVGDGPFVAACDIRGGAPGSRETAALEPENLVNEIHAIVLAGGSVFGLDAAGAVAWELARRGEGFRFGTSHWPCPVVPSAILFDLANGGDKSWPDGPPYRALALAALAKAGPAFVLGNCGAGAGAMAGAVKGGLGSASARWEQFTVGALVAVNSVGSCIDGGTGQLFARSLADGDEMGNIANRPLPAAGLLKTDLRPAAAQVGANTTLAIVATDAALGKADARRLAIMATDGLAIAIRPLHTPFDGDTVFAAATGRIDLPPDRPRAVAGLGRTAAQVLARAVGRAIWEASGTAGVASYRDLIGA